MVSVDTNMKHMMLSSLGELSIRKIDRVHISASNSGYDYDIRSALREVARRPRTEGAFTPGCGDAGVKPVFPQFSCRSCIILSRGTTLTTAWNSRSHILRVSAFCRRGVLSDLLRTMRGAFNNLPLMATGVLTNPYAGSGHWPLLSTGRLTVALSQPRHTLLLTGLARS
jgi:hypothetical protein